MDKKIKKYLKIGITITIIVLFVWFLILSPFISFKKYEKTMETAARRYFELNSSELPTGKRLATVSLQTLYHKSYIKGDFYIPNTKEPCSITESWVKVKKQNNEYKYYTYLKCGVITSNIDHKGPTIKLNGDEEITINKGEKYKELGVKSIIDNKDGEMNVSEVIVNSNNVDTSKVGTYEVTYTALDSLKNKTVVVRKVKVVEKLKNTINQATKNKGYYAGDNPNNYVYFSKMLFRIVGLDGDNVKIVAEQDVSNVNYDGIDEWLNDYYYEHLTDKSKELIVKNKYCNMKLNDNNVSNTTKCSSYTKEKNVHILSATDINKAGNEEGNYLLPNSISWIANGKDKKESFATRDAFFRQGTIINYMSFDSDYNLGVRPVVTIKGDLLIKKGKGTLEKPYIIGDFEYAKTDDKVNTRYTGEYVQTSDAIWRIIDVESDGTTKVIATTSLYSADEGQIEIRYSTKDKAKIYNPNQKGNVGYYIKNKASEFIDISYFVNKNISVPIYKNKIKYNEEISTKNYKVKLSAPNTYEMFSAFDFKFNEMKSYWMINSSKKENTKIAMADIGSVMYGDIYDYETYGIRPVGYLNKNCIIVKGKGTYDDPYIITK